jgi:serine/threonine protein kinase
VVSIRPLRADDPRRLGGYELLGRLGEGGQGVVYLGRRIGERLAEAGSAPGRADERVAVKLLRGDVAIDATARTRLVREVEAAKKVADYTARVLEADIDGDRPYVVSEYVDGPSLQQLVAEDGPRTGGALISLATATAMALNAIHRAGIVHRDLKPHNVLLSREGPRVIDFGIAKALDATTTLTKGLIGTPAYMAPEALNNDEVTAKADIFAWGATIVYSASGKAPFGGDSLPIVINRILNHDPDLGSLPHSLRALVADCLSKNPADRPTARQILLNLLGPEEQHSPLHPQPAAASERSAPTGAVPLPPPSQAQSRQPDPQPRPPDLQPPPQIRRHAPTHPTGSPYQPAGGPGYPGPVSQYPANQPLHGPGQWGQHAHPHPAPPATVSAPWGRPPPVPQRDLRQNVPPSGSPMAPMTVRWGVALTYLGSAGMALFGVIGFLVAFDSSKADDFAFGVVFLTLGGVLCILAAFAHRRRNWARIALTVLGALYALLAVLSLAAGAIATALYVVIAIVLLWVGGAQNWYRTSKAGI